MGEGINGVWTIFKKGLGPLFPYSVHKKVHVLISNKWINKNISRHHKTIADCETQGNKCYNMKFKTIQTILNMIRLTDCWNKEMTLKIKTF